MKTEIITCDLCKSRELVAKDSIQVIFTTEQTEGRSVPHHLSLEAFDICGECKIHLLEGNYIYGSGAQGYNKYWFKSTPINQKKEV